MANGFLDNMFGDLGIHRISNNYFSMSHINEAGTKIIVRVAKEQVFKTKYGYGLILDQNHVQFLKSWAVNDNWYGTYIMLEKQYFTPKQWGEFGDYPEEKENLEFETWVNIAKEQEEMAQKDRINFQVYWR